MASKVARGKRRLSGRLLSVRSRLNVSSVKAASDGWKAAVRNSLLPEILKENQMAFTEEEKRKWHADRRTGRDREYRVPEVQCAHCGAPVRSSEAHSAFPLCAVCDD